MPNLKLLVITLACSTLALDCRGIFGPVSSLPETGHYHSHKEQLEIMHRQVEEERLFCNPVVNSLFAGDWYAASPDRAPRARLLLEWECTPRPEQDERPDLPWLLKRNPALCERLKTSQPPEAFRFVRDGNEWAFEYLAYENTPSGPKITEIYTHFRVTTSHWVPCQFDPFEVEGLQQTDAIIRETKSLKHDTGTALWWSHNGGNELYFLWLYPGGKFHWEVPNDGSTVGLLLPHEDHQFNGSPLYIRKRMQGK